MSTCTQCGATFSCGMADQKDDAPCWCTSMPPLSAEQLEALQKRYSAGTCFCPNCLTAISLSTQSTG